MIVLVSRAGGSTMQFEHRCDLIIWRRSKFAFEQAGGARSRDRGTVYRGQLSDRWSKYAPFHPHPCATALYVILFE